MALEGEEEEGGRPERAFAYEKKDLCHIPERKADSNKGTFGKVLGVLFSIFIILALGFMGNMVLRCKHSSKHGVRLDLQSVSKACL